MVGALPSMLHVLYSIPSKGPFPLGKERERREKGEVLQTYWKDRRR